MSFHRIVFWLTAFIPGILPAQVALCPLPGSPWPASPCILSDSIQAMERIEQYGRKLQRKGHLLAGQDTMIWRNDSLLVLFFEGPRWTHWEWAPTDSVSRLFLGENQTETIRKASHWDTWKAQKLELLLKEGYPAAKLSLQTDTLAGDTLRWLVKVHPGSKVLIDSIVLVPQDLLRRNPLYRITGLKPQQVYVGSDIQQAEKKLKQTGYLVLSGPPEIRLRSQKATVAFGAKKNRPSSFTGILGLMPANDQTGEVLLTGEIDLRLRNLMGYGEQAHIQWQRVQVATQQLDMQLAAPFLFGTGFGLEGELGFFRIDTAFYQLNLKGGFSYHLGGDDFLGAFVQYDEARQLQQTDLQVLDNSPDATALSFGLRIKMNHLNDPLTPRSGYRLQGRWSTGTRSLASDSLANTLNTEREILQTELFIDVEFFLPIGKRMTFRQRGQGFWLHNDQLLLNQSHRIGGLNNLRGFDERSLFVSWYGLHSLEFRFILEEASWLLVFVEGGPQGREALSAKNSNWLLGTGAGLVFQTPAGQFAVHYALGFGGNQAEGFNRSKLHFGYLARF